VRRGGNDLLTRHIGLLRHAVSDLRKRHPFVIHAWVVLPEHMHCVIELPDGDAGLATRWRLIKAGFSKGLPVDEWRSGMQIRRGERGIWQRQYWGHLIRNEADFHAHVDYVLINPVKRALVRRVIDWPHSTFHRLVAQGVYPADWAGGDAVESMVYRDWQIV
jgi:putative transposase